MLEVMQKQISKPLNVQMEFSWGIVAFARLTDLSL